MQYWSALKTRNTSLENVLFQQLLSTGMSRCQSKFWRYQRWEFEVGPVPTFFRQSCGTPADKESWKGGKSKTLSHRVKLILMKTLQYFGRCLEKCTPPPFHLAASVSWCWSWEKEGRAVEVVPDISAVHWKFTMCTATRTSSHSPVGPSVFCVFSLGLYFVCSFVLFYLFVCPPFCFDSLSSWVISLTAFAVSVTNLN